MNGVLKVSEGLALELIGDLPDVLDQVFDLPKLIRK